MPCRGAQCRRAPFDGTECDGAYTLLNSAVIAHRRAPLSSGMAGGSQGQNGKRKSSDNNFNEPSKRSRVELTIKSRQNTSSQLRDTGSCESKAEKEARLQNALEAFRNGTVSSLQGASRTFDVPFSTLQGRVKGRHSCVEGHQSQMLINKDEEHILVDWCINESRKGRAWTRLNIRERVIQIKNKTPSDKWVQRFLH